MKLLKNKKAQEGAFTAEDTIKTGIIGIGVIALAVVIFALVTGISTISFAKVPEDIELRLIIDRFIMSPDCFAYQDPVSGRVYPGIIGKDRLDSGKCFNAAGDVPYAFKLSVYYTNKPLSIIFLEQQPIFTPLKTNNWDDEVQITPGVTRPVLVKEGNSLRWATILIERQNIK